MNKLNIYYYHKSLEIISIIDIDSQDNINIKNYFSNCDYISNYNDYYFLNNFCKLSDNTLLSSLTDIIIIKKNILNTELSNTKLSNTELSNTKL